MASLSVGVTVLIACVAPATLPPQQSLTWASGRYLDGMTVTFFLVGAVVLLRAASPDNPGLHRLDRRPHHSDRRDGGGVRRNVPAHGAREEV